MRNRTTLVATKRISWALYTWKMRLRFWPHSQWRVSPGVVRPLPPPPSDATELNILPLNTAMYLLHAALSFMSLAFHCGKQSSIHSCVWLCALFITNISVQHMIIILDVSNIQLVFMCLCRFGSKARRIFRLLYLKKRLEQKQVCNWFLCFRFSKVLS